MGAFEKFERGVESAVASVFSRAFQSELKPVEITSAVKKAMDTNSATMSRDRIISPNDFVIRLSAKDRETMAQWSEDALTEEITLAVTSYATEQDYTLLGPVRIAFETDETLKSGSLQVEALIKRGAVAPATSSAQSGHPIIAIGPDRYLLTGAVTVIGRGSECDITVDDTGISRRHLELKTTPNGVIATDLGSTNGSFVEGHKITAATLVDGNTITIGRTNIMFWNSPGTA